ncbi:hypothetical protein ACIHCQ_04000 [Streptomyces sp. NPDC052236]|uniref:hypothetical protein n=1 Tax=Streptomyces sp. NPDC052236 TaxID=3365686 RepID=UPI0037D8B611
MSATERETRPRQQPPVVSMRDLLASCAAASAVSTPPREEPLTVEHESEESRENREHQERHQERSGRRRDAA